MYCIEIRSGKNCITTPGKSVYIWCCSLELVENQEVLKIDLKYDSVVSIKNPHGLFSAIRSYFVKNQIPAFFQAGEVSYDKELEHTTSYFWSNNCFQKHLKYALQYEFRFAIHDISESLKNRPYIDLTLGDFSNYASIP